LRHKKSSAVLALTEVNKEDVNKLDQLVQNYRAMYDNASDRKRWGGGIMGIKAQHVIRDREKAKQRELAKASLVR
jgi:large subunit ribosomal protein L7Ae